MVKLKLHQRFILIKPSFFTYGINTLINFFYKSLGYKIFQTYHKKKYLLFLNKKMLNLH